MIFRRWLILLWIPALLIPTSSSGVSPNSVEMEYCVSFWATNITCYWNPLPETDSAMTYTLHVTEEAGRCRRDFGHTRSCVADEGSRSCVVAVENLFAFYKINLTVENQGVLASSWEKCVHGMSIVKLSAPELSIVLANRSRCFHLEWGLPGDEVLSVTEARYEIQFHEEADMSWAQANSTIVENAFADICGVSAFTNYSVRVRAKYLPVISFQSDGDPFWSDWSTERFVRTLPAAPSAGPALWRRLGPHDADGNRAVVLMWKPLQPKEANGEILTYNLHSQKKGEPVVSQCRTPNLQCTLLLPGGEEFTFFLEAKNTVGISPPTKLVVPPFSVREAPSAPLSVQVSPTGNHSLLLRWSLPSFPRMGYVFEWGPLPEKQDSNKHWLYQSGSIDHMFITEAIEPGKLYSLKVFVLINGSIWTSGSTSAYSKEIAPLRAPTLYAVRVWKSRIELHWETLPLEARGGLIRNFTISYQEEKQDEQTVVVLDSSVQSYLVEGLAPGSVVTIYITVTNDGGSTSGPLLFVRTKSSDYSQAELLFSVLCVGFLLVGSLTCLCKHRWLQKYLWPPVPDPAKSNLATWVPPKMCLDLSSHGPEKWREDFLGLAVNEFLRVLPSPPEEPGKKMLLGSQWLVEMPGALQKANPLTRNGAISWGSVGQPQKHTAPWNEVDYSKVVVTQKNSSPDDFLRRPPCSGSLKHQDPANPGLGSTFGQGIWLQNLTYEGLLDVRPCV